MSSRARILIISLVLTSFVWVPILIFLLGRNRWTLNGHRYQPINLKELGNFEFNPAKATASDIPAQFRALDGQRIIATGMMWFRARPADPKQISSFEIAYSKSSKFLDDPPLPHRFADCAMPPGQSTRDPASTPVRVWGTMHVAIQRDAKQRIASIYQIDVDKIELVEP